MSRSPRTARRISQALIRIRSAWMTINRFRQGIRGERDLQVVRPQPRRGTAHRALREHLASSEQSQVPYSRERMLGPRPPVRKALCPAHT